MHRTSRALVVSLVASLAACAPESESDAASRAAEGVERAPIEVTLVSASAGEMQRTIEATGTLFGEEHATVSAKVAGRVIAVLHDVGDELDAGAELARLDPVDYELAVAERERAYEQALAGLGLRAPPDASFDVDAQPTVQRAKLRADNAKARYERGVALNEQPGLNLSDQELADLRTAADVAQAELKLAVLEMGEQLAQLRTMAAQLETARQRLADTVLRVPQGRRPGDAAPDSDAALAPQRYSVAARRVSTGDFVAIGDAMFELVDLDPLELRLRLPERYLPRIAVGQVVEFTVESASGRFTGRVARVSPLVNAVTRAFEVRVEVPNTARQLRPGAFASASIRTRVERDVVLVPQDSIVTFAGVHKVFVVEDGRARERIVELGARRGDEVEIVSGLSVGEAFVARPSPALFSGAPVRVVGAGR